MSAIDPKRTLDRGPTRPQTFPSATMNLYSAGRSGASNRWQQSNVRYWRKADIEELTAYVRFRGNSRHTARTCRHGWHRNKFSASSRLRDLNRSATNIPSACRIATIDPNDAGRMNFSKRTKAVFVEIPLVKI